MNPVPFPMDRQRFSRLLRELLDENPFAIRPFLKVSDIVFTEEVPTLAVSCAERPVLKVNLAFMGGHCASDLEAKALVLHEFLHVLLRHTEDDLPPTPARNLAADAVINAIIHRSLGPEASSMMGRYYAEAEGLMRLLRPPRREEIDHRAATADPTLVAWKGLYEGRLVADDIEELARTIAPELCRLSAGGIEARLLGSHGSDAEESAAGRRILDEALRKALRAMNGEGIWRAARSRGTGVEGAGVEVAGESRALLHWERVVLALLRRHLEPDRRRGERGFIPEARVLPVLGPHDRRAFLRAAWSPILPESAWILGIERPLGTAQVYLDVSGSMSCEMPLVIALLTRLRRSIRMPFWAFSDVVKPARIRDGKLLTETTGGTSMASVLEHVALTVPEAAIVLTDGYIERIPPRLVEASRRTRLHVLVTRSGSTAELERARIPYTQLPEVPA